MTSTKTKISIVKPIILVGPMGAGKSTIGKRLALQLERDFFDADQALEERTGATVSWIFEREGEAGFRVREEAIIDELSQKSGIVLATGGGAVLSAKSRALMKERGIVIYLAVPIDEQIYRTTHDPLQRRPLLQRPDREQVLHTLHAEREPLYQESAHFVICTGGRQVREVVRDIIQWINQ